MHLSSHTWMRPESLETSLKRLSSLGYTSIELEGEPDLFPITKTRALLAQYNIKCWGAVTIMQGTRDLTAIDPQQRRDTIQYIKDVISLSAALDGQIVTIVPARVGKIVPTASPEQEWTWVVEALRECAEFAHESTNGTIRIGIEPLNRFETYFLNRTDQALALADAVGYGCGIAFDPFHLALEENDMLAAMRKCGSRIVDFHASDNNRLAAGEGSFNWVEIMTVLRETGYKGALAVECMPPIDRSPVGNFSRNQVEADVQNVDVAPDRLQFIVDHGSALLSEEYYTYLLKRSAETLRPFTDTAHVIKR